MATSVAARTSRLVAALLLAGAAGSACALEVAGVNVEEKAQVEGRELVLNGAGLRKRAFFQVYVIGLYLPQKKAAAAEAIAAPAPRRFAIHMLRDVDAETFTGALADGLKDNHGEAEMKALEPRVRQLQELMASVKEAKKGMRILLDGTAAGTQVTIDGRPAGLIPGEDFHRALARIWLGERPVQDDLKKALLGEMRGEKS